MVFDGLPPHFNTDSLVVSGYSKDKFTLEIIVLSLFGILLHKGQLLSFDFKRRNFSEMASGTMIVAQYAWDSLD